MSIDDEKRAMVARMAAVRDSIENTVLDVALPPGEPITRHAIACAISVGAMEAFIQMESVLAEKKK